MIKFIADKDGRPMLGLGLSRGNCERLLQGKPIFIDLKVMAFESPKTNFNEATVLLFAGETEQSMQEELGTIFEALPKPRTHTEEN